MILLGNYVDEAGRIAQGALAVIGGAVFSAIVAGFMSNSAVRLFSGRHLPALMLRWIRLAAGVAGGVAVGWIVFSGVGGWGLGGSGGQPNGAADSSALAADEQPEPSAPVRIGVTLLGGKRVHAGAFYLLDGDPVAHSLDELGSKLPPTAGTVKLRIYDDSVARDHPAVRELSDWAERMGWKVIIEELKGQTLPPEANRT